MEFNELFHKVVINAPKEIKEYINYSAESDITTQTRTLTINFPPYPTPEPEALVSCSICGKEVPFSQAPDDGWITGVYMEGEDSDTTNEELIVCDKCDILIDLDLQQSDPEISLSKAYLELEKGQISFTNEFLERLRKAIDNKMEKIICMRS